MAMSETAKLQVVMALKDSVSGPLKGISKGFKALDAQTSRTQKGLKNLPKALGHDLKIGAGLATGALAFLAVQVKAGIDSLSEAERTSKLTAAAIQSTGGVAHVTAKQIDELAQSLENKTTVDDKEIAAAETLLLRFTNVRNELGKGNDVYTRATTLAVDLSVATGRDLTTSMGLLGKSLNDPKRGLTLLSKAGVSFTDAEKKQIKSAHTHSQTLAAQRLILDKLQKLYGGAGVASADSFTGSQNRLKDAVEEARKKLATGLLPVIRRVSEKLTAFLADPKVLARIEGFGTQLAGLFSDQNLAKGADMIKGFFTFIKDLPWSDIEAGFKLSGQIAKQAYEAFQSLPPDMKKLLIGALAVNKLSGGLVSGVLMDLAGIALKSLTSIIATSVTVIGKTVTGGGGGAPSGGGGIGETAGTLAGVGLALTALEIDMRNVPALLGEIKGVQEGTLTTSGQIRDGLPAEAQLWWDGLMHVAGAIGGVDGTLLSGEQQAAAQGAAANAAFAAVAGTIARGTVAVTGATHSVGLQMGLNRLAAEATTRAVIQERAGLSSVQTAINNTTATIRNKRWSITNNVSTSISVRDVQGQLTLAARYGTTRTVL